MKSKIPHIARILLGLVFLMGSITYFFDLVPQPTDLPEKLKAFNEGMAASGYFLTLLKGTELVCGLLLVSGYFVPLALVVLAPIEINIFFVHAMLAPSGLPLALVLGALMIYLSFFSRYSPPIKALFRA